MNILLINHYAGSHHHGMEYRPFCLGREWVKLGHQVTVVAASHSHLRIQQPTAAGSFAEESLEGVRYVWLKTPRYQGNGSGRMLNMFAFVAQLARFRNRLAQACRPDAVIASSTYRFESYPALRIARNSKAKFIYEVRDLWPLSLIELGGMSRRHPLIMALQAAENFAYRHADCLVSTLPNCEDYVRQHGLKGTFAYIPNGIELDERRDERLPVPDEHAAVLAKLRGQGRFIIGYAGGHGVANRLDILVEAASILRDYPLAFVLVGQGPRKEELQAKASQLELSNVVFLPPVPKAAIPAFLAAMDGLYIGWERNAIYRFGISPNKLLDYMLVGRPVLHAVEASNDAVAECGCGISCAPDTLALAQAITDLMRLSPAEREAMGQRGKRHLLLHHDYGVLAQQFLQAMS